MFLEGLPEQMVYELLLLMYLGRGDFGVTSLAGNLAQLKRTFGSKEIAISQMRAKAPLADYLADGLERLRREGIDPDTVFAKKKKAAG